MPEKERLTPTELLSRRRNFTRMGKSNLGKRLRVPDPNVTNPSVSPAQFTQFGGFGVGYGGSNSRTAPANQFIPTKAPRQISPQTSRRIKNIFTTTPKVPKFSGTFRNKRSPIPEEIKQKPEPARELLPKKKPWKAKWIMPKE